MSCSQIRLLTWITWFFHNLVQYCLASKQQSNFVMSPSPWIIFWPGLFRTVSPSTVHSWTSVTYRCQARLRLSAIMTLSTNHCHRYSWTALLDSLWHNNNVLGPPRTAALTAVRFICTCFMIQFHIMSHRGIESRSVRTLATVRTSARGSRHNHASQIKVSKFQCGFPSDTSFWGGYYFCEPIKTMTMT